MTAEAGEGVEARIAGGPFEGAWVLALPKECVAPAAARVMARVRFQRLDTLLNPVAAISANLAPGAERNIRKEFLDFSAAPTESRKEVEGILGKAAPPPPTSRPAPAASFHVLEELRPPRSGQGGGAGIGGGGGVDAAGVIQADYSLDEDAILAKLMGKNEEEERQKREMEIRQRQMEELRREEELKAKAVRDQNEAEEQELRRRYENEGAKVRQMLERAEARERALAKEDSDEEEGGGRSGRTKLTFDAPAGPSAAAKPGAGEAEMFPTRQFNNQLDLNADGAAAPAAAAPTPASTAQKWLASTPAESQGKAPVRPVAMPQPPPPTLHASDLRWCQRVGCNVQFREAENPAGSCRFHPGQPVFHDGGKKWSCCGKQSHDFSTFLALPGCERGKHTAEKQEPPPAAAAAAAAGAGAPVKVSAAAPGTNPLDSTSQSFEKPRRKDCARCQNGFFCADHGSAPLPRGLPHNSGEEKATGAPGWHPRPLAAQPAASSVRIEELPPSPPDEPGADVVYTCSNSGCGNKFTERENTATACLHHPGPPVFHDREKGWSCCNVMVYDFDEFLSVPPCTLGRHRKPSTAS